MNVNPSSIYYDAVKNVCMIKSTKEQLVFLWTPEQLENTLIQQGQIISTESTFNLILPTCLYNHSSTNFIYSSVLPLRSYMQVWIININSSLWLRDACSSLSLSLHCFHKLSNEPWNVSLNLLMVAGRSENFPDGLVCSEGRCNNVGTALL